jgi:glycosyltransferase involved in cell wall biosynthesis
MEAGVRDEKRLLAISWALPPVLAPRAIQVARTLRGLSARGWMIAGVCADPQTIPRSWQTDPGLSELYPDPGPVERVSSRLAWPLAGRLIPWLHQRPDPFSAWALRAVQAGVALAERHRPDAIISFAQPWSCHVAGMALAQRTGLPWIAHFSDPWVDTAWHARRSRIAQRFSEMAERQVVERSDAVMFVTDEARELVMRKYPSTWRPRTHVLPHSWDPGLRRPQEVRKSGPCQIVSMGSLDSTRNIGPLCAAVRRLIDSRRLAPSDLVVRLIGAAEPGADDVPRRFGIQAQVQVEPPVSFARSLELMQSADALLVLDAPGPGGQSPYLASKTVEYLTARRPVIGLTPLQGPSAALLRRLGGAVAPPEDQEAIAAALSDLVRRYLGRRLQVSHEFDAVAADYEAGRLAAQWDALLTSVAKGPDNDATQELRHA